MSFPRPKYPQSTVIKSITFDKDRIIKDWGDMWANTWADDDSLCVVGGDIDVFAEGCDPEPSVMNTWRVAGHPAAGDVDIKMLNHRIIDKAFAASLPETHPNNNIKPGGMIFVNGTLYMSVSSMNYGEAAHGYRQRYPNSWIITSDDYGQTWDTHATSYDFFSGTFCGATFVQFGKNNAGARDEYIYAASACGYNGVSYWENADQIIMGRVRNDLILQRSAWEFYTGGGWDADQSKAVPIFEYPGMTGQNFIHYNAGIGRYIMGNYGFVSEQGEPRPYHQGEFTKEETRFPTQLTLFEASEPWGSWSVFHTDDKWNKYGGYQPSFPQKWMSADGLEMYMLSSSSDLEYRFLVQRAVLNK